MTHFFSFIELLVGYFQHNYASFHYYTSSMTVCYLLHTVSCAVQQNVTRSSLSGWISSSYFLSPFSLSKCYVSTCSRTLLFILDYAGAISKTKAAGSKNPYFPETRFLLFEHQNLRQIFGMQVYPCILCRYSFIQMCETSIICWL